MQALAESAFTPPVVERARTLRAVSVRALSEQESARVLEHLRQIVQAEGDQSKAARKLKVSQQTISKALAPGAPNVGMMFARSIADYLHITFDELIGTMPAAGSTPLAPKDQVKATPLYRHASPAVRSRFEDLAPYTRTPEGGEQMRDALWFTRHLVRLIDDEREGMLAALPPGAEPEPMPESKPPPRRSPRLAKPRRA